MPRLEAAVKIYACLSRIDGLKEDVNKKMTSMLLHPYPKVRKMHRTRIPEGETNK
jgi:hypothetical protein